MALLMGRLGAKAGARGTAITTGRAATPLAPSLTPCDTYRHFQLLYSRPATTAAAAAAISSAVPSSPVNLPPQLSKILQPESPNLFSVRRSRAHVVARAPLVSGTVLPRATQH
ncbi:hypothetical protein NDU88_009627 [Pleurodeles waltl]|uniref:Uncharacterized protein n=1 Tax=Pleurodeles waltl TaxID=8319 RepID=A0AAV7QV35_PLEWA|nr:hypothetical protein NDU88_009627 [Pleurodeles waltl]